MNDIRAMLRIAARRLETGALLTQVHLATVAAGVLVVALLLAERVGPRTFWPWVWLGPVLAALALAAAVVAWRSRRRSEIQVAVEVDERLDLREKLSTALHCADRSDPFARAAVEDAVGAARDPRVREKLRRAFKVEGPSHWWLSPVVIVVAAGIWFVPPLDLFASDGIEDPQITQTVYRRNEAIEAVLDPIEKSPELRKELSDLLGELSREGPDPDALRDRQEIQRDAIKKLTDLNKRLDEIVNGPKGKTAEAIEKSLEQLRSPKEGPAKDLADALARGDFKAAREALARLEADVADGDLTEEQKKQLADQLQDLADQMKQLADQQQALQAMLEQAGLDGRLANNPQALQQAIQNNPNLNEQQKQQLQQMAMAQQQAAQMMQGLGGAMGQMAQGVLQGELQPGAGQMGEQLNQLEAMQQMLMQAQAAAGACQGQCQGLGQGLGMQQAMKMWMQGRGGAFGRRGQGAGGKAPIAPTPTGTKVVQSPSQTGQGDIIARQFIDGPQIVGESKVELRKVAGAVSRGFDEAQNDEQLPPKYWEAHMHYFGELKKRVEAVEKEGEPAEGDVEEPAEEPGG